MDTVTALPADRRAYGSIAYYADLIGGAYPADGLILTLIDDQANHPIHDTDVGRLDNIRNLLTAARQVREAMRQAGR